MIFMHCDKVSTEEQFHTSYDIHKLYWIVYLHRIKAIYVNVYAKIDCFWEEDIFDQILAFKCSYSHIIHTAKIKLLK